MEKNLIYAGKSLISCSNALYLLLLIQIFASIVFYFLKLTDINQIFVGVGFCVLINLFIVFYIAGELKDAGIALSNAKKE